MNALNADLFDTWLQGWAVCRGYTIERSAPAPSVIRPDGTDTELRDAQAGAAQTPPTTREYFLLNPDREGIEGVLADVRERQRGEAAEDFALCLVTEDLSSIHHWASVFGLEVVQSEESVMSVDMGIQDVEKPVMPWDHFAQETEQVSVPRVSVSRVQIVTNGPARAVANPNPSGQQIPDARVEDSQATPRKVASGSVAVLNNTAVYDRIETHPAFRRMGVGTYVMRALTALALDNDDVETGLLVASAQGRLLYQSLGWRPLAALATLRPLSG